MKTRPKKLVFLAAFLILMAISFPVQVMVLYGHTPFEVMAIASKLAPLNWLIMLLAPLTGFLCYRASSWLMVALPALTALVFYNNWFVGQVGTDYSVASAALASAAFVLGVSVLIGRESLKLILNPNSRWWLTPERRRLRLPVRLKLLSRSFAKKSHEPFNEFYIKTYDLSETGAFIPLEQSGTGALSEGSNPHTFGTIFQNLAVGTQCYICLPLKDVHSIQCRAEVVRNTQGRGGYPAGVGLKFLGLSWGERRKLNQFLLETGRAQW